jgi:AbrB family looped-hinge helix DNA binding protein
MYLAKVAYNGQIAVPIGIRRKLNLKKGDKIIFIERNEGEVVIYNASTTAIINVQKTFEEEAKEFGVNPDPFPL